jgi:hypothetical protein
MFKAVIESPVGGERVKGIIFHIPSVVTRLPELTTGELRQTESGCLPPVMFFNVFEPFLGDAPSSRDRFMGMEHT